MGYYSDVRIKTTKKGYEALKNEVEKYLSKNNLQDNLLNMASRTDEYNGIVTIDWCRVKWYDYFEDVKAIMQSLEKIYKQGYSYVFGRIGEENADNEIEEYIIEDDEDVEEDLSIFIARTFEDF